MASDMLRRLFALAVESQQLGNSAVVFRKLQRMKASEPEMVRRYAELCENTSRKEAAEAYRIAFQEFQRLAEPRRALDCITQALKLDPRLEDYREQARISEALHEPVLAAAALVHTGRHAGAHGPGRLRGLRARLCQRSQQSGGLPWPWPRADCAEPSRRSHRTTEAAGHLSLQSGGGARALRHRLAGRGTRGGGRALCLGTVRAQPRRQSFRHSHRHRRTAGP